MSTSKNGVLTPPTIIKNGVTIYTPGGGGSYIPDISYTVVETDAGDGGQTYDKALSVSPPSINVAAALV